MKRFKKDLEGDVCNLILNRYVLMHFCRLTFFISSYVKTCALYDYKYQLESRFLIFIFTVFSHFVHYHEQYTN